MILPAYNDPGLQDDATEVGAASFLVKGCPASVIRNILLAAVEAGRDD